MDLFEDITRELRGDEPATEGQENSERSGQSRRTSTTRTDSDGRDQPETPESTSGQSVDRQATTDVHVCPFCETEFDANRGVCPECNAEIVLRGER